MGIPTRHASTDDSFAELIRAARAGSPEALGQLLQQCERYLLRLAERGLSAKLRGKESPSDLVQQTWMAAQAGFAEFNGRTKHDLLAWLRQILLHQLGHAHRRYEQTGKRGLDAEEIYIAAGHDDWQTHALRQIATPCGEAIDHERQALIQHAMDELPDDYRRVLEWHHRDGQSFDEIARRMNRSAGAVRKLWMRAVEKLRGMLESPDESR